ncbi:uncharacterized protein BDR25DRAFT_124253 [Lindgomyces ingoldianus]|uniref:Uncharacterized protein n=1 Tax=Lindgomyces ingoldianus TaxID=673940 RepID=A0ACB6R5Q8_9PLEO|nr:uncharacterized protein BDR25DRAFT_124253 [Lindgomyces ingoldianus]KAF2473645.1 hypothetical protein BDR25DRAFT_124253 [Lindgomyces ingoldianus]
MFSDHRAEDIEQLARNVLSKLPDGFYHLERSYTLWEQLVLSSVKYRMTLHGTTSEVQGWSVKPRSLPDMTKRVNLNHTEKLSDEKKTESSSLRPSNRHERRDIVFEEHKKIALVHSQLRSRSSCRLTDLPRITRLSPPSLPEDSRRIGVSPTWIQISASHKVLLVRRLRFVSATW